MRRTRIAGTIASATRTADTPATRESITNGTPATSGGKSATWAHVPMARRPGGAGAAENASVRYTNVRSKPGVESKPAPIYMSSVSPS